jgi:aryl-alcohol dehydrogenase-like predicted oxidoreductase
MEARRVPGTDLSVSRLVMGTMTFGSQVDEEEAAAMIDVCLDAGVNMLDTANAYNAGASESILGSALKGRRDDLLVATKVFNPMGEGRDDRGLGRAAIHKAIDSSLGRLQTEYVDLYYLHQPDWDTPIEETLEAMNDLVQSGKVRYIGVSNYAAWQICDILCRSERRAWQPVAISQQMYNLLARRVEEEYEAFSRQFGVFDIVYNPLAGGLLTGKHAPSSVPAEGTRFSVEMYRDRYWNSAQFEAVEALEEAAREHGMSLLELSYRWLLSRPLVDAVLMGASSLDQLRANLAACEGEGVDQDLATRCDAVWARLRGPAPAYNR